MTATILLFPNQKRWRRPAALTAYCYQNVQPVICTYIADKNIRPEKKQA